MIDVCLIYGNRNNAGSGGGVGFDEPKTAIAIRSCTVTDNWSSMANGHGVYFNNCKSGASLTLFDDIVSGNGSGSDECNLFIQWSAFDSEASSNCLVTGSRGDFSWN